MWLQFDAAGLDAALGDAATARRCVDLIDMCAEQMEAENCYFVLPKRASRWLVLAKFLLNCAGAQMVLCSDYDAYDWAVLHCEQ